MAGSSPYREQDVRRVTVSVPVSSVDYPILDAVAGQLVRVVAAAFLAGGTATAMTLRSLGLDSTEAVPELLLQEDGALLLLEDDDTDLAQESTVSVVADAVLQENAGGLLLEDSTDLLLESGEGGENLTPTMTLPADSAVVWPFNPHGWCQSGPETGLAVTTGSGAAVSVVLTAVSLASPIVTASA